MSMIPPKTKNDRFTDEQWQAIHQSGNNLLVAASAGSGKTTVLVQRIIEKIKNGVNVDELLVVTFTESAASEMKERIQYAIQDAINEAVSQEQYQHLVRQTTLLPQAAISTIHAFCLKVIQRFFYLIDVDPVFRIVADSIEVEMLKEDVWEDLKEILYGEPRTFFKQLAKSYSGDRNDEGLKDLIFSLYSFSRANPEPDEWLNQLLTMYTLEDGLEESQLFEELLKPQLLSELEGILYDNEQAIHLGGDSSFTVKQCEVLQKEREIFLSLEKTVAGNDYEAAYHIIQEQMNFERWPASRKKDDPDIQLKQQMKRLRDQCKDRITSLKKNYFMRSKAEQEEVIKNTKPYIEEMIRVTKQFAQHYWQHKITNHTLDFNDLEHLTLEILLPKENGKRTPSEASRYYRSKFTEVLIDEYQDVNKLQESILHGVTTHSPQQENLFMVGDVKQSIYAFRLADPGLFLHKYQQYGNRMNGERIILAENFRSRKEVISFTNFIFTQLMDETVGEMAYDQLAELKQGNLSFPENEHLEPEILLYIKEGEEQEETVENERTTQTDLETEMTIDDKATGEVTLTAQKIQDIIQEKFLIYDKSAKKERPVSYKDIVLLTPTKNNNLLILETFKEYGIPVILNDSQSFFQRTEISVILSLLKVIDNPRQDIPLAAVLRSPIVGLNERQLATIRMQLLSGDFLDAVYAFKDLYEKKSIERMSENQDLYKKLTLFLEQLKRWRTYERQNNLVSLIWTIYEETRFLDYVGGMTSGKQRTANLHALYERAKKYESTNYKGLFQFIRFIERIQSRDQDLAEPTTFSEDENAVRVMTIHASKGLEFPVVFIMDLSKQFNMQDIKGRYIFSEKYGIGSDFYDSENRIKYPSLIKNALAEEKKKSLLAEEMRKLYVALTRAEQKLYLVGTYSSEEQVWQEWGAVDESEGTVIPEHLRINGSNMMKWVGLALFRHQLIQPSAIHKYYRGELTHYPVDFRLSFLHASDLLGRVVTVDLEEEEEEDWQKKILLLTDEREKQNREEQKSSQIEWERAVRLMEAVYPHQVAARTTSYQSVSEIKRLFEDPDNTQLLQLDFGDQPSVSRYVEPELGRPAFLRENIRPTNAEIGTAIHFVMQNLDLNKPVTPITIQVLIEELVGRGTIQKNVAAYIQTEQILAFFHTDLGKRLQQEASLVKREVPFTMLIKAGNIFEGISREFDDHLLIHGIMDGYIEYPDHLVLFDFKTDYVGADVEPVIQKYRGQMNIYRQALEEIKQKKVTETYLCLLSVSQNILMP